MFRFLEKIRELCNAIRLFKDVRLAKTLEILPCLLVQLDINSQNISSMLLKVFSNDHLLAFVFYLATGKVSAVAG